MRKFSVFLSRRGARSAPVAVCAGDLSGQEVRIGSDPLTTPSATFGVEMRQAVDLAIDERNAAGGVLGGRVIADANRRSGGRGEGKAVAKALSRPARGSPSLAL